MNRSCPHSLVCRCLFLFMACLALGATAGRAALPDETDAEKDARMAWWRDAKFGMFVHWGLYSIPAGEWNGKHVPGYAEWIMNRAAIPRDKYAELQKQFNPTEYDADQWVDIAKRAGMKYIVITSKHHDGFCLFHSEHTDYDMAGTPYGRDLLKPLAEACHREGLQICWYHSIMDWHHADASGARFPKYVEHMKAQLKELLTNYGKIGVLWFDGEWIGEWSEEQGIELEKYLRDMQPDLIVNNRVGKRKPRSPGDFGTPEQEIPATGIPGWDWETCMTINSTWGYSIHDDRWKTTEDLVRKLIDIVSKGGNFLLNVGPTADGVIPEKSVERLEGMGRWLAVHGESIYGTTAGPLGRLPWGRCTAKPGKLYLHVFDWPQDGRLLVPRVEAFEGSARLLADAAGDRLAVAADDDGGLWITLPQTAPDPIASVVVLEGSFEVGPAQSAARQAADGSVTLRAADAVLHGERLQYETGGGKDNVGFWTNPADWAAWEMAVKQPGTFRVEVTYACPDASAGSRYTVDVGGEKLSGTVEATGSWTAFKTVELGRIRIVEAGKHALAVRAQSLAGEGVMNLRSVALKPAGP